MASGFIPPGGKMLYVPPGGELSQQYICKWLDIYLKW